MNPADRWNPGWQQFMMNQPNRANAGGNRQAQMVQQPPINPFVGGGVRQPIERNAQPRRQNAPAPNPNRRNHHRQNVQNNNNINNQNAIRRDNRAPGPPPREPLTRDDLERIETVAKKNFQTRTALEYDKQEEICWTSIQNNIEENSRQFSTSVHHVGDIFIPNDDNICSNLRIENQNEVIMKTREILVNYGATEQDLSGALANLEIHLRTNAFEYNVIDDLSNELMNNAGKLAKEMDELDHIMHRLERIRLNKN